MTASNKTLLTLERKCDNHDRGGKKLALMTELNVLLKAIVLPL